MQDIENRNGVYVRYLSTRSADTLHLQPVKRLLMITFKHTQPFIRCMVSTAISPLLRK